MANDLIRQEIGTKRAGEDMTAARGKAVVFNSLDRWQIAGLTGPFAGLVQGILTNNPANGDVASVQVFGVAMAKLGGTVTGGRYLDVDANGDLIENHPDGTVGVALESGVAGSLISIFLISRISPSPSAIVIGSIVVGGNTTATVISTINTFVDLNLGSPGAVEEGNIELFTLTNAVTGEIRYDGLKPVSLLLNGLLAAVSAGGGQRFNFRLLQNGSPLPSPDNVDIPIEIGTNLSSVPIHWPIKAVTGDLFRLQVENSDGTSDITIDTLKFAMV